MAINEQILVEKDMAESQSELVDKELNSSKATDIEKAYWKGARTTLIALGLYTAKKSQEKQDKQDEQDYRDWNGL